MQKGGKRKNAGRKKGSLGKKKLEEKLFLNELRQRVMRGMHKLITSQMNLAIGVQMLFVITTDKKGNRSKPELVTDQRIIEQYLAGELDDGNDEYYFITTERADNRAIDSLFDRTFGKANLPVDLGVTDNLADLLKKALGNK